MGNARMTTNDFILLFTAFGGFVIAPTLLFWGLSRLTNRKQDGARGPNIRPDVDSPDATGGDRSHEIERSRKANDLLRRRDAGKDRPRPAGARVKTPRSRADLQSVQVLWL